MELIVPIFFFAYFLAFTLFFAARAFSAFVIHERLWKKARKQFPKLFDCLVPLGEDPYDGGKEAEGGHNPCAEFIYLERLARARFTINIWLTMGCLLFGRTALDRLLELIGK